MKYSDAPQGKDLETFPNPGRKRDFTVRIDAPEFTCVCPKTGHPDFANLVLEYVPDKQCIELKAYKLYIHAWRNVGIFHEAVTNRIADDLIAALRPKWLRLTGAFHAHGGITTTVTVEHGKPLSGV
ncbi:MAG: NADPH-dependent 7-cyano-7-deazaguanine reductase QueF [Planctomycetes bacterium]|nr:NADPH-dependent 7-cyano-7-deazaguanine reductase QueF [Planctomycetota bacterium]